MKRKTSSPCIGTQDEMGKIEGKYTSYKEALDAEIGKYGFVWKKSNDNSSALSYDVDLTDGAEEIYKIKLKKYIK